MKILIISNSRTGSTNLMKSISSFYGVPYSFEPFNRNTPFDLNEGLVLKTLINQNTYDFYVEFSKKFDKVILLSRRDVVSMSESLYWVAEKWREDGFRENTNHHLLEYEYNDKVNVKEERIYKTVKERVKLLKNLSKELNIPLDYYEDIYLKNHTLNDPEIGLDVSFLDNSLKLRK